MTTTRTLVEDEQGFHVERGKRRNLLNSAGSDIRPNTLGHRSNVRALTDTYCLRADGTAYVIPRHKRTSRATTTTTEAFMPQARYYRPVRHSLDRYIPFLDRFPNVVKLYRLRPTSARTVSIDVGAGRGW